MGMQLKIEGGLMMKVVKWDIDKLLEDTTFYNDEEDLINLVEIEIDIDMVLAVTKDW
jgi:hypothetical protein